MFNNFPYTNFHNLNLDWIVKTVKLLFNKAVFSINNVEPDDDGNVTITGAELGAVGTVNNIAPVNGNVTLTASDVGAVAVGQGVTKVNGFSPDSSGNVLSGTVRSINGISPASLPTPGNVVLNASDVGALPSTIDPVETVNGISPDAQGNVNVGTVKSVNGSTPDAQGNVNLPTVAGVTSVDGIGPDAQGNVQTNAVKSVNNVSPVNGNVTIKTIVPHTYGYYNPTENISGHLESYLESGFCCITGTIEVASGYTGTQIMEEDFPTSMGTTVIVGYDTNGNACRMRFVNHKLNFFNTPNAPVTININWVYKTAYINQYAIS